MNEFDQNNGWQQEPAVKTAVVSGQASSGSSDTLGIIALICGICSIVLTCCGLNVPCAIAAIILAFVAKNKTGTMSALTKVGLILGIIGAVLAVVSLVFSLAYIGCAGCGGALSACSGMSDPYGSSYYYY